MSELLQRDWYYSKIVEPQVTLISREVQRGTLFFDHSQVSSLEDIEVATERANMFVRSMNFGLLEEVLQGTIPTELPNGEFFLAEPYLRRPESTVEDDKFKSFLRGRDAFFGAEGMITFGLGFIPERGGQLVLGVVSFSPSSLLSEYNKDLPFDASAYPSNAPAIVQIQGPSRDLAYPYGIPTYTRSKDHEAVVGVWGRMDVARALIGIVEEYADRVQSPCVYVLPARMNLHYEKDPERLTRRYDRKADQLGYKPDVNGLWKLNLSPLNELKQVDCSAATS